MDTEQPQTAEDWAFEAGKHYKTSVRFVLISLARSIDKGNPCPSHKDLSEMTGVSKDTVRRALGELEKDGLITIVKNGGDKVKGGHKDCYDLPKYTHPASMHDASGQGTGSMVQPVSKESTLTLQPLKHDQHETGTSEYVRGDVREEVSSNLNTSSSPVVKDKKTPLPAKAGKGSAQAKKSDPSPAKPVTPEGREWADLIAAIGEVFGAYKIEAVNYANMLTGKAKKGLWGECAFEVPVIAAELRRWSAWYHHKNPGISIVKQPPLVYSSITEWRNLVKSRPPQPVSPSPLTPEELDRLRPTAFSGVIKIGEAPYVNRR